ncbi:hypothetical protein GCM10022245_01320 [Streptomyces mayteni]
MPTDRHDIQVDETRVLKRPSPGSNSGQQARIPNSATPAAVSSASITFGAGNSARGQEQLPSRPAEAADSKRLQR